MTRRRTEGLAWLVLGVVAWMRAWQAAAPPPAPERVGQVVPLDIESLRGDAFRLLPGVGPTLAERLETARRAAGGRLRLADLEAVAGVGPELRRRWEELQSR
jgi:predicted flap endonuclease-1-like 5' DNA nuclease